MPRHSLFPNSVTINYTSNGHSHKQVLPVGVVAGSAPGWTLPTRDGGTVDWRLAVSGWANILAGLLDDTASVDSAELYTYEATGSPAELLAVEPLDVPGDGPLGVSPWTQQVFPFKALGGTSTRITVIEGWQTPDSKASFASTGDAQFCTLMEFILSDDDWIITRGGTFPFISLGWTSKINDKLRKKYLLDA